MKKLTCKQLLSVEKDLKNAGPHRGAGELQLFDELAKKYDVPFVIIVEISMGIARVK